MKNLLAALALALSLAAPVLAFASPAVTYNCVGKNKLNGESVVFELLFSDHDREVGYSNQSITVTKRGWEVLAKPITFQMYGASEKNNCKTNEHGEIFMHGGFSMDPSVDDYGVSFKTSCNAETAMDVKGVCFFQN